MKFSIHGVLGLLRSRLMPFRKCKRTCDIVCTFSFNNLLFVMVRKCKAQSFGDIASKKQKAITIGSKFGHHEAHLKQ